MRVTKIPGDAYFDDRERVVTLNDKPVDNWIAADMFRNVVETPEGPKFGSVYIQPLPPITIAKAEIVEPEFPAGSEWKEEVKPAPLQIRPRDRYKK